MSDIVTQKQEIFDYVSAMLGGGMIDVELDPQHYEISLRTAFDKFRQRSDNSVEESYIYIVAKKGEDNLTYSLLIPEDVDLERDFSADYENGLLVLKLNKKEAAKKIQINIK